MQANPRLAVLVAAATAVCGSSLVISTAHATQYWDGGGVDANWNTAANWGGDALPAFSTTAINFGSLSSAAGTGFGNVVVPTVTTTNNDLTAGSAIKGINFGNNGQANRTDAYTLQGNSIQFGAVTNDTIGTAALHASAIVSSIEDVIQFNINLGTPGAEQNRQFQVLAKHALKIEGVISGGANAVVLARVTDSKLTFANASNSYLGPTNIAEGTTSTAGALLEVTGIANGGSNSSIGASSNAAANLRFGYGFNDTSFNTLRYIGGTDASTDRLFTLYGNISGTNTAIESSGAGTLSFTNTGAIASGHQRARNFHLGGTNTGNNTFAPSLSNFTEVSTFTKQGTGKWILTGNHTYTGATTVSDGTLLVNGSVGNSAVTVNAGAFGGSGSIGSSLTLNTGTQFHVVDLADALQVTGTVSIYSGFGVDDLVGINWGTVAPGTYTLINGTLGAGVFAGLSNNSPALAYDVGGGKEAYFQEGSLQLVVAIPEPATLGLLAMGAIGVMRRRRA